VWYPFRPHWRPLFFADWTYVAAERKAMKTIYHKSKILGCDRGQNQEFHVTPFMLSSVASLSVQNSIRRWQTTPETVRFHNGIIHVYCFVLFCAKPSFMKHKIYVKMLIFCVSGWVNRSSCSILFENGYLWKTHLKVKLMTSGAADRILFWKQLN